MTDAKGKVLSIVFNPTPAYLAPKETQELIDWTETNLKIRKYNPLLVVGNFIVEFLNIHPFQDGNGRLSRVLTNLLLLKRRLCLYAVCVARKASVPARILLSSRAPVCD